MSAPSDNAWRAEAAPKLLEVLGWFPAPVPLNAEVEYSVADGDLIRERVVFDSDAHMSVPCQVLRPRDMRPDGSHAAILCSHGHGTYGKDAVAGMRYSEAVAANIAAHNYNYAQQMAQAGYLTITPDLRVFGERRDGLDPFPGRDPCNVNFVKGALLGIYTLTLNIWDIKCCIDYLETRPEVDKNRIGMMGLSQGGVMTTFTTAVEPRIKAADISGYINPWRGFGIERANFCGSQIVPNVYRYFDTDDIAEVVSRWTGIPVSKMLEGEREKLLKMEQALHERVVGQDEAVKVVSDAVRRARAGLADPNRPDGSFLFLGPTGVGKTELCKALAGFLFDTEEAMVRIDMSEFMEKHSVSRLVGAPPGYVGYEEGGYLTEAVRRRPYSVILLDEVEKAHPDVFNILLQVLDDGRLTDGQGRTVDFRNTVIVMTSNLGSHQIQELSEDHSPEAYLQMKAAVMGVVQAHFRPEFINRLDDIVVFHPLDKAQIKEIARIQMRGLERRLAERGIRIEVSDKAFELLGNVGFDPVYGARPLKRAIQQELENPLAQKILAGEFGQGDTVKVDADGALHAGKAVLPGEVIARGATIAASQRSAAMGRQLDPAAYVLHRAWVKTMVLVVLDDPDDPTPYWLVSTRHPEKLLEAFLPEQTDTSLAHLER